MSLFGSIKLALLFTLIGLSALHSAPAPPPVVDCSTVLLSLTDCFTYVSAGSNVSTPEPNCCKGLRSVLKPGAKDIGVPCLCDAFINGKKEYGVDLNMTRAVDLPSACNVKFSITHSCNIGSAPAPAPAPGIPAQSPPAISLSPSVPGTPSALVPGTPSSSTGAAGEAPSAQAPGSPGSSSSSLTTSVASLVFTAIAVVLCT